MATHCFIPAWTVLAGYSTQGREEQDATERLSVGTRSLIIIPKGVLCVTVRRRKTSGIQQSV